LQLAFLLAFDPTPLQAGDHTRTLTLGDQTRTYQVHVPRSYDPKKPTPVVLAFHGAITNGGIMKVFCGLDQKAEEAGFLVVYPDGTGSNKVMLGWHAFGL